MQCRAEQRGRLGWAGQGKGRPGQARPPGPDLQLGGTSRSVQPNLRRMHGGVHCDLTDRPADRLPALSRVHPASPRGLD